MQRDILELESQTWSQDGSKISEFRRRYPRVTETAYYLVLNRLLSDQRAYEHDDRRYAPMLVRLNELQAQEIARRAGQLRTAVAQCAAGALDEDLPPAFRTSVW